MERTCAECRFFKITQEREDDAIGTCRLGKVMGVFRSTMRACPSFSPPGAADAVVADDRRRRSSTRRTSTPAVASQPVRASASALLALLTEGDAAAAKATLAGLVADAAFVSETSIGRAWSGGTLNITPANASLQSKEVPLDQYFHKLVMVRDQLRVFEQKVNSCSALQPGERLDVHRRLLLIHSALLSLATGWGHAGAGGLLADLRLEVEWQNLVLPAPTMGPRWAGGRAVFSAGELHAEESMQRFFQRIVVLRDRLRTLEAEIEAHAHIPAGEASAMTNYIRRCFGSLTTFNLLFADRADYFSSSR